jgi:hypothetical protein
MSLADTSQQAGPPSRRDARQRQEARVKFVRAAIVTAFFAAVMGANLYVGAVVVMGTIQSRSDDVSTARTGRVSKTLLDGTFCRAMTYDNTLAQITGDKIVPCDELKTRRRSANTFSWGKE